MHSSSNRESLEVVAARAPAGDLLGSSLQLRVGLHDTSWITSSTEWTSRFCLEIVNKTSRIQLIHWFDTFSKPSFDIRTRSGEVVAREVTLSSVVRWDVDGHADQNGIIG